MIVLDASATVELVLDSSAGRRVADSLGDCSRAHYPELMPVEVVSALRRLVARNVVSRDRARDAVRDLSDLAGHAHRHGLLLDQAFVLSTRFSVYDAMYVALADVLDATLLTADARLARQASTLVSVTLVP